MKKIPAAILISFAFARIIFAQEIISPTNRIELFNGTNFDGFTFFMSGNADPLKTWSVTNGVIHCNGTAIGYLRTLQSYSNYVVTVEWRFLKVTPKANNTGVLVHMQLPDKIWPQCIQNQGKSGRQGDLFVMSGAECKEHLALGKDANTPVALRGEPNENAIGEWNTNTTVCKGNDVKAVINGKLLNEITECTVSFGFVGIQSEGADFEIRKMFVEPLTHDISDGSSSSKTASKEFIDWEHKQTSQSQVVAYATANTNDAPNIILTVSEFWKGADEAMSLGITNGMQFPMRWPTGQTLPDGAIMFFPHDSDPSKPFLGGGAMFVQKDHVADMTFQEFKSGLGL
jgi:hypothetical protein